MDGERFRTLLKEARIRSCEMQSADAAAGFASPENSGNGERLRTAMTALCAGMECEDWSCVADAYVLLEPILRWVEAELLKYRNAPSN